MINYITSTAAVCVSLSQPHNKDVDILFAAVLFFLSMQNPVLYILYMNKGQKVAS